MVRSRLLSIALVAAVPLPCVVAAGPAGAAVEHPKAEQAFKKGVLDVARLTGDGTKAKRIRVSCVEVAHVDDQGRCTGTFELTRAGRTARYVLTGKAETIRLSPRAIEYHVVSKAETKVKGLPGRTGLAGFLQ